MGLTLKWALSCEKGLMRKQAVKSLISNVSEGVFNKVSAYSSARIVEICAVDRQWALGQYCIFNVFISITMIQKYFFKTFHFKLNGTLKIHL